jgi:SAM-dependent methyltransferase
MRHDSADRPRIDDDTVRRYWDGVHGNAAAMSMMTHEHNLPPSAAAYRISTELRTIRGWLDAAPTTGKALDVGCGAGTWVEIFAERYDSVIGVERSGLMVAAARQRVAHLPNASVLHADVRKDLPQGPFDVIFLGGLCMYLNDADVVGLVGELRGRLAEKGTVILRESTVPKGVQVARGEYQAVYRNVGLYARLFEAAGMTVAEVRRNYGYNSLVTAEELVSLRRKWLPFLPKRSTALGAATWLVLRGTSPLSLWALPRALARLNLSWPRLQNHFFKLQA